MINEDLLFKNSQQWSKRRACGTMWDRVIDEKSLIFLIGLDDWSGVTVALRCSLKGGVLVVQHGIKLVFHGIKTIRSILSGYRCSIPSTRNKSSW